MFNGIQYGIIPFFIQNYILKIGMKHPLAIIFENEVVIPEIIFERVQMSFYEHFLMFNNFNGEIY
jgi:hypothetical protein